MRVFIHLILFATLLFSCAKKDKNPTVEKDYIAAKKKLDDRDFSAAAEDFEKLDEEYPFSYWGTKGRVMALYARYKNDEDDKVIQIADDFISLNPTSEYLPYVLYMKGRVFYNKIPSIKRAQDSSYEASAIFRELIARFPDDFHSDDAVDKLSFIDEHIAGAKMEVGRNHIKNRNYVGAIANFHEVVRRYRYTDQVPESYYRLVATYCKIGLKEEATKALKEANYKYPDSEWTKMALKIVKESDDK